jgi:crotonobetainyl-CoA:carnitine CoA-transferase CaiB-like acyl-CoA transferase
VPIELKNVRIIDLSRVLAGPLGAMILGDLGADVIKIEKPDQGDESRGWGPPFDAQGQSAYYLSCNRNKLSIALDLDLPGDRDVLGRLMQDADVVLENFREGALAIRGIRANDWLERNPKLIWCTISGFGPGSDRPGYDFVVQAECGWMSITGEPAGEPMKTGVALADVLAGKDAAIAILGALLNRDRSRHPLSAASRQLHVSLQHSATAALINVAQNTLVSGGDARRWGNAHANLVPYQLFAARDGQLVIAVGNDGQWKAACAALGLEELAGDASLDTNSGRLAQRERVVRTIAGRLATADTAHWLGELGEVGVPCGVVRSVKQALLDVPASPVTGVAPSVPGTVRRGPPKLDEHGALIRREGWGVFGGMEG